MFIRYITFISAFNYFVFGMVGLLRKSPLRKVNVLLGMVFLLMSFYSGLIYYYHIAFETSNYEIIKTSIPIEYLFCMGMGPLFYYYLRKLLLPNTKVRPVWFLSFVLSFLPAIIFIVYILTLPGEDRVELVRKDYYQGIWQTFALNLIFYVQMTVSLFLCYFLLKRQLKLSRKILVNDVVFDLNWIYILVLIDIVYMLCSFPLVLFFPAGISTNLVAQIAMNIQFVYIFSRIVWHNSLYSQIEQVSSYVAHKEQACQPVHSETELSECCVKEGGVKLTNEILMNYSELLLNCIQNEKPYLNENCTLQMISENTGISVHHLSFLLNSHFKKSFSDFINEYRVNEAKLLLQSDKYDGSTIESLSFDCGFGSKSNFNKAFKKIVGVTPSQYRKTCKS